MLLLHIAIALTSVTVSTYMIARPSRRMINVSYGLIAATTASGVYLMTLSPAYITHGCIAYIAYSVTITTLILHAKNKLAHQG